MSELRSFKSICNEVYGKIKGFKGVYIFSYCEYPSSQVDGVWYVEIGPVFNSGALPLFQLTESCKEVNKKCKKLPEEVYKTLNPYEEPSIEAHGENLCVIWSCSALKDEIDTMLISKYDTTPQVTLKKAIENLKNTALDVSQNSASLSIEDTEWEQIIKVRKK